MVLLQLFSGNSVGFEVCNYFFRPFQLRSHGERAQVEGQHPEVGFPRRADDFDVFFHRARNRFVLSKDPPKKLDGLLKFLEYFVIG